jgi:hypothetical protein
MTSSTGPAVPWLTLHQGKRIFPQMLKIEKAAAWQGCPQGSFEWHSPSAPSF